ncbi:MAG: hypothetical protein ACHQHM_07905, partial [Thermoanaerobaculales bacterium]
THLLSSSELPSRSPAVAVGLLAHARSMRLPSALPVVRGKRRRDNLILRLTRKMFAKGEVERDHV